MPPFLQGSIRFFRFIYSLQQAVQGISDSLDEIQAVEDHGILAGRDQRQTLGHLAILDGLDAGSLKFVRKGTQLRNLIRSEERR